MSKKKLKKQTNLELTNKARKINSNMTRNSSKLICIKFENNRTFYHDVTAVIQVFANKIICLFWEMNSFLMQTFPALSEHKYGHHENAKKKIAFQQFTETPLNNGPAGPVSRKPRRLFGPVKSLLVHLYLKTGRRIRLKLLV